MTQSPAFGNTIREAELLAAFFDGPGEFLVAKTLLQMAKVPGFTGLFGPFTALMDKTSGNPVGVKDQQRWADYDRQDWSMRQLPAVNVYEADTESKSSSQAYLEGTVNVCVFWPPSQRRSDWARVQTAFKGALQGFFESQLVTDMLDEIYWVERPAKVPGLNHYGRMMTWSPNVEGIIEGEMVPVTLVAVKYRIDLRSWYRYLNYKNRTKETPFVATLTDLKVVGVDYQGIEGLKNGVPDVHYDLHDEIAVNPS